MPELSPQAQQVFWEFNRAASGKPDDWHYLPAIAAALCAAADQVVPDQGGVWTRNLRGDQWTRWEERKLIRAELLAIVAELKGS